MIETWGGGNRQTKGRPSKLDIIRDISVLTHAKSLDIGLLNLKDLREILKVANTSARLTDVAPQSTFKSPYLTALKKVIPNVHNLEKLTVASLKALTGALSNA